LERYHPAPVHLSKIEFEKYQAWPFVIAFIPSIRVMVGVDLKQTTEEHCNSSL
jgi:hypothetical protein